MPHWEHDSGTRNAGYWASGRLSSCSAWLVRSNAPAGAAELYAPETLDRYFQLEWSRAGENVNGYVYNTGNRRAAHMILLVEGLDGAGKTVTKNDDVGSGRSAEQSGVLRGRGADRRRLSGVGPVLRLGRRPSGSPQGLVGRSDRGLPAVTAMH